MVPQSGPLLLVIVVAGLWQWDVGLGCYGDIGRPAAQGGVPSQVAHEVAGCSPSDALPQTGPRDGLDSEGLDSCGEEGNLEKPRGGKDNHLILSGQNLVSAGSTQRVKDPYHLLQA